MVVKIGLSLFLLVTAMIGTPTPAAGQAGSRIVTGQITSASIAVGKVGASPTRNVSVYLPAGYADRSKRYPVIYYLANFFEDHRAPFAQYDAKALIDRAIAGGTIGGVIVVAADFTTPAGGSWFVNSAATGNWEDFMVRELVPYIDARYRTLPAAASRGVLGDRLGGYGAIRFGMVHPEVFGSVYALHPVGTGSGLQTMHSRPNWELLANAKSMDDVSKDGFSQIFTTIFQAHLPNADRPPLFFDPPARREGERLVIDFAQTARLHDNFFLDRLIPRYANNLNRLRGFKFDWSRSDPNQDHVYANQAFAHKLDEFGVGHEAEEYRGGWADRHWGEDGRIYTDALPFFAKHLAFSPSFPMSK